MEALRLGPSQRILPLVLKELMAGLPLAGLLALGQEAQMETESHVVGLPVRAFTVCHLMKRGLFLGTEL